MSSSPTDRVLAVRDLRIAFGPDEVVHGVDLDLRSGRVLALVGESGSGKSVTAMALLGLLPRTSSVSGSVKLAESGRSIELLAAPSGQLRRLRGASLAAIFQEPASALNPVFTIGDQIGEALLLHEAGLGPTARSARVRELLSQVEVDDPDRLARAYPHQASGGQLQRAMIAMAIANDPAVLIADEPTTALDVTVQAGILDLLRGLRERLNSAVLLITHDMGVVADLADDVAVMQSGSILETGPVSEIFAQPRDPYTRELLAAVPRITLGERSEPPSRASTAPAAELRDAVVRFADRGRRREITAVDHVTLQIEPGEFVGLVGESGSGKSTIGRALSGLVPVQSGSAWLAGTDLRSARGAALRRARASLGMVFQDPAASLNPRHSVGRSISDPLRRQGRLESSVLPDRVSALLRAVRLDPSFASRFPHQLSGGQRQRVALARALSVEPMLVIADEPTSALDVSVQQEIIDLLRRLQSELGFACLFISHDLGVVSELTSRVAVMHRGSIVEEGPTGQVLTDPAEPHTRRLLAAVPVPDPVVQAERRSAWRQATSADRTSR